MGTINREQFTKMQDEAAFPQVIDDKDENGNTFRYITIGMSKREYFAAAALQGLLSHAGAPNPSMNPSQTALAAIQFADVLITHLDKTKK